MAAPTFTATIVEERLEAITKDAFTNPEFVEEFETALLTNAVSMPLEIDLTSFKYRGIFKKRNISYETLDGWNEGRGPGFEQVKKFFEAREFIVHPGYNLKLYSKTHPPPSSDHTDQAEPHSKHKLRGLGRSGPIILEEGWNDPMFRTNWKYSQLGELFEELKRKTDEQVPPESHTSTEHEVLDDAKEPKLEEVD